MILRNVFENSQKKIYIIRKSIKCGMKCKKFHKELLFR